MPGSARRPPRRGTHISASQRHESRPADAQPGVPLARVLQDLDAAHPGAQLTPHAAAAFERFTQALLTQPRTHLDEAWAQLLGPVATPRVTAELLNITRRRLDHVRDRGEVLGVRTGSGRWVYPLRQFRWTDGTVRVLHRLEDVLGALYTAGDAAGAARWLATPNRHLRGFTPWETLWGDGTADLVVDAAQSQAGVWSSR